MEDATRNALIVLEACGLADVPVAAGAETPLEVPLHLAGFVHGADGLGDVGFPDPAGRPTGEHAADQIIRLGRERPASSTCSPSARSPTSAWRCGRTPRRSRATGPW